MAVVGDCLRGAVSSSETLINFYQTTQRHIPLHFHGHRCENLKSYLEKIFINFPNIYVCSDYTVMELRRF
jgi:hypothetical protein